MIILSNLLLKLSNLGNIIGKVMICMVIKMKREEIDNFIANIQDTVQTVLEKINLNAQGIVFICKDRQLSFSISDGDIRRFILSGGSLNSNCLLAANKNPIYITADSIDTPVNIMKKKSIKALPVVNEDLEIIDIKFLYEKPKSKSNIDIPLVIMAGGKGTRLKPYTDILPKPLIPINGLTITEHIMNHFSDYGCHTFTMIVNYRKELIEAYFKYRNYNINFIEEETFLGTAGGLSLINNKINGTFFLTNCDVIIEADYREILESHQKKKNIITVVCARKKIVVPYGVINFNENLEITTLSEKPTNIAYVNTGLYVIDPAFINEIPTGATIDLTDVITICMQKNLKTGVYLIEDDSWFDMGQFEELTLMREHMERAYEE